MRLLCVLFLVASCSICSAQRAIETTLEFRKKTNFPFTGEWQYLSTDLYLFNSHQFGKLVNELVPDKKAHRKTDERLESLCITATLKNLKFFGNQPVVYPIFNFKIDSDKDKNYATRVSQSREVIRILENLPLSTTDDIVEAEIKGDVISNKKRSKLLKLVTSQLGSLAKLANPTTAVLSLVGELGSFLTSSLGPALEASKPAKADKQHYEFSSTIRLYEGDNFNQKIYSVRVYTFLPPGTHPRFDARGLDRILAAPNPELDRKTLERALRYSAYPYIVAVNYKSIYQMPTMAGDQVTLETIEKRRIQVERDYEQSLINAEIYHQENDYIEFLEQFAEVKKYVEAYSLAYEIRNTDDISKNLFAVLGSFGELQKIYALRKEVNRGKPIFEKGIPAPIPVYPAESRSLFVTRPQPQKLQGSCGQPRPPPGRLSYKTRFPPAGKLPAKLLFH